MVVIVTQNEKEVDTKDIELPEYLTDYIIRILD